MLFCNSFFVFIYIIVFYRYDLKGVIIGKIYFLLIRLKIKHMEIALLRRESAGTGPKLYPETETLLKYEIMEGAPVRGNIIFN